MEIEVCNLINVFTASFDSFNASLLNKSFFFYLSPLLNCSVRVYTKILGSTAVFNTDNTKKIHVYSSKSAY